MSYVFVSYSHKDSAYAHRLAQEMKARGIEVWIDDRIDYGDQWPRVIQKNLAACGAVIVIMTTHAYNSDWVQSELSFAQHKNKPILPLLLEGDLWVSLAATQHVDVRNGSQPPEAYFERVKKQLGTPVKTTQPERAAPKPPILSLRQSLEKQIVGHIMEKIHAGVDGEWEIGLFQIRYIHPQKGHNTWAEIKSHLLTSGVDNLDLLLLYDPTAYWEWQDNHEQAKLDDDKTWQESSEKYLKSIKQPLVFKNGQFSRAVQAPAPKPEPLPESLLVRLRKRLNLYLYRESATPFTKSEVKTFVMELLMIHESHHIPFEKIQLKNIK